MKRAILLLSLLAPGTLSGQIRTVSSVFLAADGGVAGDPLIVGATVGSEVGPLGFRVGMALDIPAVEPARERVMGLWSGDADAMLFLGNPTRPATLTPYGLVGVGFRGLEVRDAPSVAATWSYGGGVRMPLFAGLGMEGEARYRQPLAEHAAYMAGGFTGGIEVRFGMNLRLSTIGGQPVRRAPVPAPMPMPRPVSSAPVRVAAPAARAAVAQRTLSTADQYLGVPYRWGGNSPHGGFDCSGFIHYVFRQHGISVPRVSRDQARAGVPLPLDISVFEPGDVLAFASNGSTVDHTAIYAGNGRIIHSSSSGGGVRYDDLYSQRGNWYRRHLVAARRIIDAPWSVVDQ
jgi:cell wall-associated NlpC family hydrolase